MKSNYIKIYLRKLQEFVIIIYMDKVDEKFLQRFSEIEKKFDEYSSMLSSVEIASDPKLFRFYETQAEKFEQVAKLFSKYKKAAKEAELAEELLQLETNADEKQKLEKTKQQNLLDANELFDETKLAYIKMQKAQNERAKIELSLKNGQAKILQDIENIFANFAELEHLGFRKQKDEQSSKVLLIEGDGAYQNLSELSGIFDFVEFGKKSSATVLILKEEQNDFVFDEADLLIQTSKSGGAGGQHINKTESAVKITHIPTGISAECEDERSQTKNKDKALENLKNKIAEYFNQKQEKNIKSQREKHKSAIFSDTPTLIFDFDKNKVTACKIKKAYDAKDILSGNLKIVTNDIRA